MWGGREAQGHAPTGAVYLLFAPRLASLIQQSYTAMLHALRGRGLSTSSSSRALHQVKGEGLPNACAVPHLHPTLHGKLAHRPEPLIIHGKTASSPPQAVPCPFWDPFGASPCGDSNHSPPHPSSATTTQDMGPLAIVPGRIGIPCAGPFLPQASPR